MENHKKLAHLLDVTQCVGCSACIVACAQTNYPDMLNAENTGWESLPANIRRVSAELARRPVELLVQCQQCENAPCITVCPFGANSHDPETGQVKTDPSRCVGCGYCVTACPYDARWMHPKTGLPVKCMGKGCVASEGRQGSGLRCGLPGIGPCIRRYQRSFKRYFSASAARSLRTFDAAKRYSS